MLYQVVTTFDVFERPTTNHYSLNGYHCNSRLAISLKIEGSAVDSHAGCATATLSSRYEFPGMRYLQGQMKHAFFSFESGARRRRSPAAGGYDLQDGGLLYEKIPNCMAKRAALKIEIRIILIK
jgi:hypothetical protein